MVGEREAGMPHGKPADDVEMLERQQLRDAGPAGRAVPRRAAGGSGEPKGCSRPNSGGQVYSELLHPLSAVAVVARAAADARDTDFAR